MNHIFRDPFVLRKVSLLEFVGSLGGGTGGDFALDHEMLLQ